MIKYKLTAVVPVSRMSGRLDNLNAWLTEAANENIQVIIVHDRQDANTGAELIEIVNCISRKNVILVEEIFNSPGLARNYGMNLSLGEWITFWDSDDLPSPSKYLRMITNAESAEKQVALGSFQSVNRENQEIIFRESNILDLDSIFLNPGFWRMAFKSELLRNQRFTKYRMAEDQLFIASLNLETSQIYFEQEIIYTYMVGSETQLTRNPRARIDLVEVTRLMQKEISEKRIYSNFSILIFIKLCLTQIKISNVSGRIWAIRNILTFITKPSVAILIFSTLLRDRRNSY